MKVFLIGFMGSGKTSIGKKLAHFLKYDFIDLDKLIEVKTEMSIAEYFVKYGEEAFRKLEREVLQNTVYPEKIIVATGGGMPCYFDNMDWMNKNGITAYLSLPSKTLANRLENSKTERPLIQGLKGDELVEFVTRKLAEREVFYNKAKFSISAADLTAEKFTGYLNSTG